MLTQSYPSFIALTVMILANHGTVSYGETVEQAYWWTEILDSYCRMLMLSRQLGNVSYLSGEKSQELLDLKDKWGYKDPRNTPEYDNCDICANDVFRDSWAAAGVERRASQLLRLFHQNAAPANSGTPSSEDAVVKAITDEVIRQMQST